MGTPLHPTFFGRNALEVARSLIGTYLVHKHQGKEARFLIRETEAYLGEQDKASHASRGKTQRNEPMFGPAGHFYVYLTYGMYWMLNIVTGKKDHAEAVLIRATGPYHGPGKLTRALRITKSLNGKRVEKKTGVWVESNPALKKTRLNIHTLPRVGVSYAGPVWANKPYRFLLQHRTNIHKDRLIEQGYIPFDKSWIIRMGILDFFNGYQDIFSFLTRHRVNLSDDLTDLHKALLAWKKGRVQIPVGESGTLYRFLLFASWKLGEKKKFLLRGTLRKRSVVNDPNLIHESLSSLLSKDRHTSQWASASVLFGNKERITNPPYKLNLTYRAVSHWKRKRNAKQTWDRLYDKTILRQARTFLNIYDGKNVSFSPMQAEDYCFARAFGFISQKKGKSRWPSLRNHESDRIVEMERVMHDIDHHSPIRSKDHRAVQAGAMRQKMEGQPIRVLHPKCVSKSWPQFWKFLKAV